MADLAVIILTLNEEENLPGAMESVQDWAREVFVVDSLSADRTIDLALEHRAQVVQHRFTSYGDQWNWALERLPIKAQWILKLDADERVSDELAKEIDERLRHEENVNGFIIPIRLWFMGKCLHVRIENCRLWRRDKGRVSRVLVNEHLQIEGKMAKLRGFIEHVDCQSLERWREKQDRYTTMEAIMHARGDALAATPKLFGAPLERRMFLKRLFYRTPFRFQLLWLHELVVRGAWRAGRAGMEWAGLRVSVYRSIDRKTREMIESGRTPELPQPPPREFDPRILSSPLQRQVSGS